MSRSFRFRVCAACTLFLVAGVADVLLLKTVLDFRVPQGRRRLEEGRGEEEMHGRRKLDAFDSLPSIILNLDAVSNEPKDGEEFGGGELEEPFGKPLLQCFVAQVALGLSYPVLALLEMRKRKAEAKGEKSSDEPRKRAVFLTLPAFVRCIPMCFFDVTSLGCAYYSLLYLQPSLHLMLNGSTLVFCAVLLVLALKRTLVAHNWAGVGVSVVGILLVGLAPLLSESSSGGGSSQMLVGIVIRLAGGLFASCYLVLTEHLISAMKVGPLELLAITGVNASIVSIPLLVVCQVSGLEDVKEGVAQMLGSPLLIVLSLLQASFCYGMHAGLFWCTSLLSSVHTGAIASLRVCFVWLIEIGVFYATGGAWGEGLTVYSPLRFVGFMLIIYGTLVYSKAVRMPWVHYTEEEEGRREEGLELEEVEVGVEKGERSEVVK